MSDKKLSLHIGENNSVTTNTGFSDQIGQQGITVGGPGYGGSGGSLANTRPPVQSGARTDVTFNDSITRDSSGTQTGNKDPDLYYLA